MLLLASYLVYLIVFCFSFLCQSFVIVFENRYQTEQELGTEIKPIPSNIDQAIYCQ